MLLADALGTERLELYTGYHKPVEPDERDRFRDLVKRRARREPVAYLLGEKGFYSLSFEVTAAVLIPRPETEHVAETALGILEACATAPANVLDLGTGSGNLAVTIAVHASEALVDAVDNSNDALVVARQNARRHSVDSRVRFFHGDLFEPVRNPPKRYSVIVSNPPYVRSDEIESLTPDVRLHEPVSALLDSKSPGGDGLGFYRAIANEAGQFLLPGGSVIVEVGERQAQAVAEIFIGRGLSHVETVKDYRQTERVVVARNSE